MLRTTLAAQAKIGLGTASRLLRVVFVAACVAPSVRAQTAHAPPRLRVAWTRQVGAPSFGSAAVADIDGDGRLEVAFGTYFGDGSLYVLNAEDGSKYWRYHADDTCWDASVRFVDLDRDGRLELIAAASSRGRLLAFDARTGDALWRYEPDPLECIDSPSTIADIDGDGALEVAFGTFAGRIHVVDEKGLRRRVFDVAGGYLQTGPAVADLNGDGTLDFVCATFKSDNHVYAIDGRTGARLWSFRIPGNHLGSYHGGSFGELDGDGVLEFVFSAYDGRVYCLRACDGAERWVVAPGDRCFMSPCTLVDVDGDGRLEVAIAGERVSLLSAHGRILWSRLCVQPGGFDAVTRGVSVADLDGDGHVDLASLSGEGLFLVFDGMTGTRIYEYDAAQLAKRPVRSTSHGVTLADLTGDGHLDAFFVLGGILPRPHGLAVCLSGFAGTTCGWYTHRHDNRGSGNASARVRPALRSRIEELSPHAMSVARPRRAPRVNERAASARRDP